MFKDYVVLAFQNLLRRKLRSWLTLLGICIGIATVVSLVGLGEGLREGITGQFNLLGNDVLTIQATGNGNGPPGAGAVNPLTVQELDKIKNVQGVRDGFGRLISSTLMTYNDEGVVGFIGTMPNDNPEKFYELLRVETVQGRLLKKDEYKKILVGIDVATDGKVFKDGVALGKRIVIKDEEYEVVGIMKKKGSFIFDQAIIMNEEEARAQFNRGDVLNLMIIQVVDVNSIDNVKQNIDKLLRRERDVKVGEEDFSVQTAASNLSTINGILAGVNIFIAALASISIIVGGIGIANTMFTSVLERTNQIGIMKAIGARNSDIFWLFLIESGLLGVVGGIVGVTLGILFAYGGAAAAASAFGSDLFRTNISAGLVVASLFGSFIVGGLSGIIPAMRAAKLVPVEALRYGK